jgi:hypothetical protein
LTQEPSLDAGRPDHGQLSRRTVTLACIGATAVMLVCAWWFVLRETPPTFLAPDPEMIRRARAAQMGGRAAPEDTDTKTPEADPESGKE